MATNGSPALDEIIHRRPDMTDWWVNTMGRPSMHEDFVHRYISESPFFDWSSKNGLTFTQSQTNMPTYELTNDRKEFEKSLKRQGVEFMIVGQPQAVAEKQSAPAATTGIYNIRKQDRQRVRDSSAIRSQGIAVEEGWELTPLGSYFIIGENVYQAPSVGDVVGNRLLSAASSLSKFFDTAADLPRYSPANGYTYLPPTTKSASSNPVQATPSHSREGSLAPGVEAGSSRAGSLQPDAQAGTGSAANNVRDTQLMVEALRQSIAYGDEYGDENPLTGEPGHFSFTSSIAVVKKRRADEEAAALKSRAEKLSISTSQPSAPKADNDTSPPAVFMESKAIAKLEKSSKEERRGSKMGEKIKRKKSRHNALSQSPTTPGGWISPSKTTP